MIESEEREAVAGMVFLYAFLLKSQLEISYTYLRLQTAIRIISEMTLASQVFLC